jgi:DNA-binding response OmpR family regulator
VGLGLAISKALAERMGGSITLNSEGLGKGTVVTLMFAVASPDRQLIRPEGEPTVPIALVVGTDTETRQRIAASLGFAGYVVRQASTEDSVRALAAAERIDVVVVDVTSDLGQSMLTTWLDGLTGPQREGRRASLVLLANGDLDASSRVQLDVLARSRRGVAKPVDPEELVRTLDHLAPHEQSRLTRILVVDDDPSVFSFLTQALPTERYSLLYARNGHEGLQMAAQHPCDAMLLDLRMPDGSGYDVIRALRLGPSPSTLPIIVLTNYPEPTSTEERQLLHSRVVLEVFPKTGVVRDPKALIDRLDSVRGGTWLA